VQNLTEIFSELLCYVQMLIELLSDTCSSFTYCGFLVQETSWILLEFCTISG